MSALWTKLLQIVVPWLLEKAATIIARIIRQKKRDGEIKKDQEQALEELKKAETKEEVESAAKNTLGL